MESETINRASAPLFLRSIAPVITLLIGAAVALMISKGEVDVDEKKNIKKPIIAELLELKKESHAMKKVEYGRLRAWRTSNISSEVQAKVIEVHSNFREGHILKKGMTVIKLDTVLLEVEKNKLNAEIVVVESEKKELLIDHKKNGRVLTLKKEKIKLLVDEINKKEKLYNNGRLVSKQELDQLNRSLLLEKESFEQFFFNIESYKDRVSKMNARIESVKAMHLNVVERIKKSNIVMPFTGRFQAINVELGAFVNPGQSLFTLLDDSQLEVSIPLLIEDIEKYLSFDSSSQWYQLNQKNKIVVSWEGAQYESEGVIKRIAQDSKLQASHNVVVSLKNTKGFKAGMFVKIAITGKKVDAIRVPNHSVYGSNKVYVLADNKEEVNEKKVEVLYVEDKHTYIQHSDLEGRFLVVTQLANPYAGLKITPME